jgi:hypothetical protein
MLLQLRSCAARPLMLIGVESGRHKIEEVLLADTDMIHDLLVLDNNVNRYYKT